MLIHTNQPLITSFYIKKVQGGPFDGTEKGHLDGTERGPLDGTAV